MCYCQLSVYKCISTLYSAKFFPLLLPANLNIIHDCFVKKRPVCWFSEFHLRFAENLQKELFQFPFIDSDQKPSWFAFIDSLDGIKLTEITDVLLHLLWGFEWVFCCSLLCFLFFIYIPFIVCLFTCMRLVPSREICPLPLIFVSPGSPCSLLKDSLVAFHASTFFTSAKLVLVLL